MKKFLKIALIACMMFATGLTSVSAASYTTRGQIVETGSTTQLASGGLKIELLPGTYVAGTYEVGAHAGIFTSNEINSSQDTKPWYLLATFNLSSSEVATLKNSSIYKDVTSLKFDFGVSNLQVKVGTGNYNAYTGSALTDPTTPTNPTNPSTGIKGTLSAAQLAPYSALNMTVYPSSRVTKITSSGSTINLEGYMFKQAAHCNKKDSIWREIVFVNEANSSSSYAYRKQVIPVYNTFLNSNMTATVNGTYKLDYANYKLSFSPTSVNAYTTNKPAGKMAAGSYLMYMRISDGSTSYLFPLMDIQLSNGTTMENTGTLPANFEVVETKDRTLRYIVK